MDNGKEVGEIVRLGNGQQKVPQNVLRSLALNEVLGIHFAHVTLILDLLEIFFGSTTITCLLETVGSATIVTTQKKFLQATAQ